MRVCALAEVNAKLETISSKADPARIVRACANTGTIVDMLKVAKKRKWFKGNISELKREHLEVALIHTLTAEKDVAPARGGGGGAAPAQTASAQKKGKDAEDEDSGASCVIC